MRCDYKRLVVSGGGAKGYNALGALYYFHLKGYLDTIDEFYGTSIGALICCILAVGIDPFDAFHWIFQLKEISSTDTYADIVTALAEHGMQDVSALGDKLRELLREKIGGDLTFHEVYRIYNKKLTVVAVNIDTLDVEYFSHETHPTMLVSSAVELSCCLPGVFRRKLYGEFHYIDGGFADNYPIEKADDFQTPVLGINLIDHDTDTTGMNYFMKLLYLPMHFSYDIKLSYCSDFVTNVTCRSSLSIVNLFPSRRDRVNAFLEGYSSAKEFEENEK